MKKRNSDLKIGFVIDDGLDSEDGVQAFVKTLGEWLSSNGCEVHYLAGQTKRSDIKNIHSLSKNISVKFNGNKLTIPLPVKKSTIKEFLNKENFDILHVQIPHSPFFGARVVSLAPKSTVVISSFHILPYGHLASFGTRVLGMVLRNNLKKFDKHTSVSTAAQEFSKKTFKIETKVITNLVNLDKYKSHNNSSTIFRKKNSIEILFLGRLVDRKGCSYLIDALHQLRASYPDDEFRLTVCGKGILESKLKKQVNEYGLETRVEFKGFVTDEQKIIYMKSADIAVFPSYAGESFGIVLIEAMAAGSGVVLGGDNPGYRTVLGRNPETLIDVKDTRTFADTLHFYISNADERAKVHDQQQKVVLKYDVNHVGKQFLEAYNYCKNHKTK